MPVSRSFSRDGYTWLAYWMGAYYAYLQAALGPAMPYLRAELGLSYTLASYHFSAFAVGMILAGVWGANLTRAVGRGMALWGGAAIMGIGGLGFIASHQPELTIASTFIMGFCGSITMQNVRATLSDHHPDHRNLAIAESNIILGLGAGAAALVLAQTESLGIGWRWTFGMMILVLAVLAGLYGQIPIPQYADVQTIGSKAVHLPRQVLVLVGVMLLGAAVEWSMNFWGASYLEAQIGLSPIEASRWMGFYFLSFILGRWMCSQLVVYIPPERLLLGMLLLSGGAFLLFWQVSALATLGLLIFGLGIAHLTPLVLSLALRAAPTAANTVSARISLAAGLAILLAPQLLGRLADAYGLQTAYALIAILLGSVVLMVGWVQASA